MLLVGDHRGRVRHLEVPSVFACSDAEVADRGEVGETLVRKDADIDGIQFQVGIVQREAENGTFRRVIEIVEDRCDVAVFLDGPLGDSEQEEGLAVERRGPGVECAHDLEIGP